MKALTKCPTCGSPEIKRVTRSLRRLWHGTPYVIPSLTFDICANCGEKVFDPDAMQKIQQYSPAYAHLRGEKVVAKSQATSTARRRPQRGAGSSPA